MQYIFIILKFGLFFALFALLFILCSYLLMALMLHGFDFAFCDLENCDNDSIMGLLIFFVSVIFAALISLYSLLGIGQLYTKLTSSPQRKRKQKHLSSDSM